MPRATKRLAGTVNRVEDHGTIVTVWVRVPRRGEVPVHFDHTPFRHMVEAAGMVRAGEQVTIVTERGETYLERNDRLDTQYHAQ